MAGNQNSGGPRVVPPTAPNAPTQQQPIRVPTGQQYGQATQQANAQRAIPLPQGQSTPTPPPSAASPPQPFSQNIDLTAPTANPSEPLSAGAAIGPGPDTSALSMTQAPATGAQLIQSLAQSPTASPEIRALWSELQGQGTL